MWLEGRPVATPSGQPVQKREVKIRRGDSKETVAMGSEDMLDIRTRQIKVAGRKRSRVHNKANSGETEKDHRGNCRGGNTRATKPF